MYPLSLSHTLSYTFLSLSPYRTRFFSSSHSLFLSLSLSLSPSITFPFRFLYSQLIKTNKVFTYLICSFFVPNHKPSTLKPLNLLNFLFFSVIFPTHPPSLHMIYFFLFIQPFSLESRIKTKKRKIKQIEENCSVYRSVYMWYT